MTPRKAPEDILKAGRPTDFRPEYIEQAYKLCVLGAKDKELADFFNVTEQTINNWKNDYPPFFESLKQAKADVDGQVVKSLYKRAMGYTQPTQKAFQFQGSVVIADIEEAVAADTTAAIFWLKNRQPKEWRDKQEVEHSGNAGFILDVKEAINGSKKPGADSTAA